ncbi:hypothetical protein QVD17_19547 [Tagetes erecta]|uniref:Uncharacterized protein n=1 Tax=Tagetes erecta TaxID=13708 RepID=A0AAD8KN85_TARER|nr:hypothetical protein QVD17_19547 [Tagetes erecta]
MEDLIHLFSLSIVQCLRHRVSTTTRDLNLLESMAFDTVSLEELLGHYNEIYKKNESDIVEIEDRLSAFCIWLRSCYHASIMTLLSIIAIECWKLNIKGSVLVFLFNSALTFMMAEKYGLKGQAKPSNGTPGKPNSSSKSKPEVDINVGLSERPPWFCRFVFRKLCKSTGTNPACTNQLARLGDLERNGKGGEREGKVGKRKGKGREQDGKGGKRKGKDKNEREKAEKENMLERMMKMEVVLEC